MNVPCPPSKPKLDLQSTLLHSGPTISANISLEFTSRQENSIFTVVCIKQKLQNSTANISLSNLGANHLQILNKQKTRLTFIFPIL